MSSPMTFDEFLAALRQRESSGNYRLVNDYGYMGAYQFGEAALYDLGFVKADGNFYDNNYSGGFTGKLGVNSVSDFLNSRTAQDAAAVEWFQLLWVYLKAYGVTDYAYTTLNGYYLTPSGMLAGAHLLGASAVRDFILSGGTDIGVDAYGTPITHYIELLAGYDMPFVDLAPPPDPRTFEGTPDALYGDTLTDFTDQDRILFKDAQFETVTTVSKSGGVDLRIDDDRDGNIDGTITLTGDFSDGRFLVAAAGTDTEVTFHQFMPVLADGAKVDPATVNGVPENQFFMGDGTKAFDVRLQDMGFAAYDNVIGVYEVDESGAIVDVRLLFENANADRTAEARIADVEAGHRLAFFVVQNAADWAASLKKSDVMAFLNGDDAPAHVTDGSDVYLAVNGRAVDRIVFHSYDHELNPDGIEHALSGIGRIDDIFTIGFEDMLGGGDLDYEDLVFTVDIV